mmetsp:Transcript_58712/g.108299  ORF Transcript_58712/g.108299 Transcript_58712/m.108299 type:complete len:233 (+) Transcript_58712:88-786(+)
MVSSSLIFNGSISGFVGVLLGIVISLIVNCTLVEISISSFFSLYFGILFIVVGGIILWRIFSQEGTDAGGPGPKKMPLTAFACLIILSGLICFTLERHWYLNMTPLMKVPLYMILGTSVAFALTFSVIDLVNYVLGFLQVSIAKPFVESAAQVYMVLVVALVMGGLFGLIFGIMDVEDEVSYQIRLALLREEHYCYPVGAILGGLVGFGNEYIRETEERGSSPLPMGFDEEI